MANPFWLTNAIAEYHSIQRAIYKAQHREGVLNRLVERMSGDELAEYVQQTKGLPDGTTCTFCHTPGVKENEIELVLFTSGERKPVCSGCYGRYEDACREAQYLQDEQEGKAINDVEDLPF
jgi:hypothetical protein